MKAFQYAIIALILIIVGIVATNLSTNETVRTGKEASIFTLKDVEGNDVSLQQYEGKTVVVHFFATWCSICRKDIPDLVQYAQKERNATFLFIGKGETIESVQSFINELNLQDVTFLADPDEQVAKKYQVLTQPETIIIKGDRTIYERAVGPVAPQQLEEWILNAQK